MKSNRNQSKSAVASFFHQFALQQIEMASDYVTDNKLDKDVAIHETRRCLKRLRAILRLLKKEVGETIYDRDNRYFRDLGQQLSKLRDTAVVQETFEELQKELSPALAPKTWETIQKDLGGAKQNQKRVLRGVAAKLKIARAQVDNWPLKPEEHIALHKALRKTYQKGCRAMDYAIDNPKAENFHEWRKQVNHLRHQLQILRTMKIKVVKKPLKVGHALAKALGLNNDLAVLTQQLLKLEPTGRENELQKLRQLIQSKQAEYEAEAIRLGHRLYRKSSKSFIQSLFI